MTDKEIAEKAKREYPELEAKMWSCETKLLITIRSTAYERGLKHMRDIII